MPAFNGILNKKDKSLSILVQPPRLKSNAEMPLVTIQSSLCFLGLRLAFVRIVTPPWLVQNQNRASSLLNSDRDEEGLASPTPNRPGTDAESLFKSSIKGLARSRNQFVLPVDLDAS